GASIRRGRRAAAMGGAEQARDSPGRAAAARPVAERAAGCGRVRRGLEAPTLAREIAARQQADPRLRTAAVQREVLNVELPALQHALMLRWRMPALLVQISDNVAPEETVQMRNVRLAIRVARHTTRGWDDPALPDDITDIGALLQLRPPHVLKLLQEIDAEP
ncbi:MAG: histidine kinase, partial [Pseudomonadota bacterium]